jgi:S1-C subfamily serine protease
LIGINTAIYSPSGAYAGIGFAVPVDSVNRVVPQLVVQGKYVRPSIGVVVDSDLNRIVSRELGIQGVLVLKVEPGSVAEGAGLRGTRLDRRGNLIPGDMLLSLDGEPLDSVDSLLSLLDGYAIGDRVTLRIWREGDEIEISLPLQGGG